MRDWLLAALSGILLFLSFPPLPLWPLAWVALAPLLITVRRSPDLRTAANRAAVCGLVFYAASLHWLVKVFGAMAFAFWCLFSLWLALHSVVLWRLKRRGAPDWAWVLASGALMTGIEHFRSEVWWLDCSWLALGYSQTRATWLLQAASVVGLYGVSGLIAASAAAAALAAERRFKPAAVMAALVFGLAVLGAARVHFLRDDGREVATTLVQDESYDLDRLAKLSLSAPAELVVWPEYAFTLQPNQDEAMRKLLARKLAGSKAVAVLAGAVFPEDMKRGHEQNFAWVLSADGALLARYDKTHPIPYVETRLPRNRNPRALDTPLGRLGVEICYDLDFEDVTRRLVGQGARLLVVPDLDPGEWGAFQHAQHSAMSAARAVESGLWVARAASSGESQFVDPAGRTIAALPATASGALSGRPRLREPGTIYSRLGWLVPRICLAAALGLVALA